MAAITPIPERASLRRRHFALVTLFEVTLWGGITAQVACPCGTHALVVLESLRERVTRGTCHACGREFRLKPTGLGGQIETRESPSHGRSQ